MTEKLKDYDQVLRDLKRKAKIITQYDIPYFAGYDWDGTKVYIDRDVPQVLVVDNKKLNLHLCLAIHEYVEKKHINKGYTYAGAHEIATQYEKAYVESKGIAWKDYDKEVGKLMHTNWMSKLRTVPEDLDMTPMEYSRDIKTLAKIRRLSK